MIKPLQQHIEKELSAKLGAPVRIQDFKKLGGGCINHACRLETSVGDFFIKWNSGDVADLFVREAESLRELAKADTELLIPKVYLAAQHGVKLPAYRVTEFLPPPDQDRGALDALLGRGVA